GKHCTLGGNAGVAGHLDIADGVHIAGKALISKSITEAGAYSSATPQMPMQEWRRNAVRFRQLDDMAKRLQKLEKSQEGKVSCHTAIFNTYRNFCHTVTRSCWLTGLKKLTWTPTVAPGLPP